ncbi:hypothetical protein VPH234P10_0018 [Vibrio phage 234P10]|nr:hypothetical protein SIPHO062v1_p0021 [Vibrio phage PS17B.1]
MKGFHYLNTSFTDNDVMSFLRSISPNIPAEMQYKLFLRSLGVRYDAVIPTDSSRPLGYATLTECPATRTTYIRQVVR